MTPGIVVETPQPDKSRMSRGVEWRVPIIFGVIVFADVVTGRTSAFTIMFAAMAVLNIALWFIRRKPN
jgi:hypothetical protein